MQRKILKHTDTLKTNFVKFNSQYIYIYIIIIIITLKKGYIKNSQESLGTY